MTNFQQRTLTTIIGGAIMIGIMIVGRELLLGVLMLLGLIGYYEMAAALGVCDSKHKVQPMTLAGYLSIIAWYLILELDQLGVLGGRFTLGLGLVIIVFSLLLHMTVYVFTFPRHNASFAIGSFFAVIYPAVMLSFLYMIRNLDAGAWIVWYVLICSWICDISAYLVGIKFGRHKMSPKLSPKKSIEGAVGGVAGSALVGGLYAGLVMAPRLELPAYRVTWRRPRSRGITTSRTMETSYRDMAE